MAALLVLALGAVAVLSVVQREHEPEPVAPPPPAVELGRSASPPKQPARRVRRRPPPVNANKPVPVPPMVAAEVPRVDSVKPDLPSPATPSPEEPSPGPPTVEAEVPAVEAVDPLPDPLPQGGEGESERIARAIAAERRAAVRACFEHELKEQPKLAGTVVVELELAPPTRVDAVRVSDDLNRPAFTRCVTMAMQGVRFAALDEELSVSVPYVLSPSTK